MEESMNTHPNLISNQHGAIMMEVTREVQIAILEALRYNYGRHTAATGDTATWAAEFNFLNQFDDDLLGTIWRDINEFMERRERFGISGIEVYDTDVQPFVDLQHMIEKVLGQRGFELDDTLGILCRIISKPTNNNSANNNSDNGDK